MLSVNQLQAQVKLTEMWKAANFSTYPLKIEKMQHPLDTRITRSVTSENFRELRSQHTFIGDATRLWNSSPNGIRMVKTISIAKKEMKTYCKSLPF